MKIRVTLRSRTVLSTVEYRAKRPRLWWRILSAAALLGVLFTPVFMARDPFFRGMMVCALLGLALFLVWMFHWMVPPSAGTLRIAATGPLRFTARKSLLIYSVGGGTFILAAGLIVIYTWLSPHTAPIIGPVGRGMSGLFFVGLGLTILTSQVPRIFIAHGLILDQSGVSWTTTWGTKRIPWEDLDSVTLGAERGARQLWLRSFSGSHHALYPMSFGSDPESVAEIIEFFRRRPSRRGLLVEPLAAIRTVADIREPRSQRREARVDEGSYEG